MRARRLLRRPALVAGLLLFATQAQAEQAPETLFRNVRVFDGKGTTLSGPTNVLVRGKRIAAVGAGAASATAKVVAGEGRTLMPGLIDAHTHIMLAELPEMAAMTADIGYITLVAARTAERLLLRGFTSIREAGDPSFALKRAIDEGLVRGPRIWPAGAMISQTSGHGDFRLPSELPAAPGALSHSERMGAAAIADGPDLVRMRVREQLRQGASQSKLMAGGGVTSRFDPLDVTQYSLEEMRAAVEAAEHWGTYGLVHAYTPRAKRRAVEAGVRCIEHGQLADADTAKLLAEKGVWWSLQPFLDDEDANPRPEGSPARAKPEQTQKGTHTAYRLAIEHGVRVSGGTDTVFAPGAIARSNAKLTKLRRWYTPGEVLRIATGRNGELLALSGPRAAYAGPIGVIEPGALADLILVDGDPVADLSLIEDPERRFPVIMKGGGLHKDITAATSPP